MTAEVHFISSDGIETVVDATAGESIMQTALANGVPGIIGECGGTLTCATCHVFVDDVSPGRLAPMEEMEDEMLDGAMTERRDNSRLSCQLRLKDSQVLWVTTPPEQ